MKYEIVATLGPSSSAPSTWQAMLEAGASAFRLNTSHLSLSDLAAWLERLSAFLPTAAFRPAVVLDLQGSKWRLGEFPACCLVAGHSVHLIHAEVASRPGILPVPHADFFTAAASSNGVIALNDAKIRLSLENIKDEVLTARVLQGGELTAHKGITLESSPYRTESLSEKDQAIVESTRDLDFVCYAISYVKDSHEMRRYRDFFGRNTRLIAKLERGPALEDASQIASHADHLWLCRGDLGAELGLKGMAQASARFSKRVREFPASVLLAGQVFEHMKNNPTPTRSEVSYLYEALLNGYMGVVLSDETAMGDYPVESCRAAGLFLD